MKEVLDYLRKCHIFYLATEEGDQPRVRPFGIAEEFEGKVYIQTGKVKNVSKQIQNNNKIEICACDGPTWLRLEAKACRDDRREAKVYILDKHPELKSMYSPDDENTEVLYLKDCLATFYSFTEVPRRVEF
jgi:uncharacterized pyridoxamine 5'-phosphate oxidase family protein